MKAFVLAAGEGTRLRPLTEGIPKCLVPIQGVPLLGVWLDLARRHAIDELLINLHWKPERVREFIRHQDGNLRITLVEEKALLGSAGTIRANWSWVEREDCFWVFYADVLTNMNLGHMLAFHRTCGQEFTMGLVRTDEPHRCGVASVDPSGRIIGFEEKPKEPRGNLAFSGVFLARPSLYAFLPTGYPSDLGQDVFPSLVGRMQAYEISEYLLDVGTILNYQLAQETWPGL